MKNFYKKGLTFLEVIIVVAVIAIIVAVASPQLSKIKNVETIKGAGDNILSALDSARAETLASLNSSQYGVHFAGSSITIFPGTSYSSGNSSNQVISISPPVSISAISLSGGGADVYFNRLSGTASTSGTVTLSVASDSSLTKIITISALGLVSMN